MRIGELEIIRRLGAGGFGTVYLAADHRLERKVAVKIAHAGRGDLWREARAAARLSHPNVVAIHEIGEHEGNPYLVMEYVDGVTLRERLAHGRLPRFEALRIARELAAAIAAAHHAGVLHLDLTPTNVLLSRDGRVRVVDFGLARALETSGDAHGAGTPGFMAPEQWRGEPLGPPADVWALGAITHLLLTGVPLLEGGSDQIRERVAGAAAIELSPAVGEGPHEVADLVRRCLRKDPAARPRAEDVVNALETSARRPDAGPFRGLASFGLGDAAELRGREGAIAAVLALLQRERAVAITGASGCGKSSLVQAGVVAQLRADGWTVAIARPGREPLAAISSALRSAMPGAATETRSTHGETSGNPDDRAARWASSPAVFAAALAEAGDRFVLVIDQLEELETLCEGSAREAAAAALSAAIADDAGYRIIATLRSDLAAQLTARVGAFGCVYELAEPDRAQLAAILAPASLEPGLAEVILDDITGEPGSLALLQLAGAALWGRRDREGVITAGAYAELGGVAGIFERHVAAFLAGCAPAEAARARAVLGRGEPDPIVEALIGARIVVARADGIVPAHRGLAALHAASSGELVLQREMTRRRHRRMPRAWIGVLGAASVVGAFALASSRRSAAPVKGDGFGECASLVFAERELLHVFNAPRVQDAVAAISEDGASIASYRRDCNQRVFTPLIIDDLDDGPVTLDLTNVPALANTKREDGFMTMTSDALTLIVIDASLTGFVAARRSARGVADFQRVSGLVDGIRITAPAMLRHPAISPDGLAFYYSVLSSDPEIGGMYESVRPSLDVGFRPGTRLPPGIQLNMDFVTATSGDRLSLFVQSGYSVTVFQRRSIAEPFGNPWHPLAPRTVPGFRTRPFAGCQKLVGTCTSGCNGEESCVFEH